MKKVAELMVILRSDLSKSDLELLDPVVHQITRKTGSPASVLWCKSAVEDGSYLKVQAKLTKNEGFSTLRIQQWLVLAIAGESGSQQIGFVWEESTQ